MPARRGFLPGVPMACGYGKRGGIVFFAAVLLRPAARRARFRSGEKLQYVPERFGPRSGTKNEPPIRWASNSCDRLPVNMWIFCLRAVIERGRRTWYVTGTGETQVHSNLEPFVSNSVLDSTIVERANPRLGKDLL